MIGRAKSSVILNLRLKSRPDPGPDEPHRKPERYVRDIKRGEIYRDLPDDLIGAENYFDLVKPVDQFEEIRKAESAKAVPQEVNNAGEGEKPKRGPGRPPKKKPETVSEALTGEGA